MRPVPAQARFRIGELARRTGTSPELLRAWERRYGLLEPARTQGGFRLYSDEDERRVRAMQGELERGAAAAQAAERALAGAAVPEEAGAADDADSLVEALLAFDEGRAQAIFDRALAVYSVDAVLGRLALPALRSVGERWSAGEATVAQEHFASTLLRGRLLGLARGWGAGTGPRALLACPPGEQHDLGLIAFGLALRGRGWRVVFLGPDTPVATVAEEAARLRPELVVLAFARTDGDGVIAELAELGRSVRLAVGGGAATPELADAVGAVLLEPDPVAAAEALTAH